MKYVRGSTLLPLGPEAIRSVPRVPWRRLPAADLVLHDEGVSNFFFEFEPEEDIELFLQHAHLGCKDGDGLLASREDLASLAVPLAAVWESPPVLPVPAEGELTAPLRFVSQQAAFEAIRRGGRWRGMITCCSCGIAGCFSQDAWVERGLCLVLLTIKGATLVEVDLLPFRVAGCEGRQGSSWTRTRSCSRTARSTAPRWPTTLPSKGFLARAATAS